MEQSFVRYTGDGETVKYTVPFPYIYQEHVKVRVSNALVPVYWIDGSTVELPVVPTEDDDVLIYRDSDLWNRLVDYKDGSMLQSDDLNIDSRQTMFLLQEAVDQSLRDDIDWSESKLSSIVSEEVDVQVTTGYILNRLTDGLTESQLAQELRDPINKVDDHDQLIADAKEDLEDIDDRVTINETEISEMEDEIKLKVSQEELDGIEDRVSQNETEISLNADEIQLKASQTHVDTIDEEVNQLASEMELTAQQWTVKIDSDGYVVGTGLIIYPNWSSVVDYKEDDMVWHEDSEEVYRCIEAHTDVEPPNTDYWEKIDDGARSEFIVRADKFAFIMPDVDDEEKIPFVVGEVDGVSTVGVNGELVVDGSIYSNAIATDAITVGHIGDPEAILNINQLWDEVKGDNRPEDSATENKTFLREEPPEEEGESKGDIWIDLDGKPHIYDGDDWKRTEWKHVSEDPDAPEPNATQNLLIRSDTEPDPDEYHEGDMWVDASDGTPYVHDGDEWQRTKWNAIKNDPDAPEDNADVTENSQVIADLQEEKLDAIIDGKTVIVGGYLNTEFIETDSIVAEHLVLSGADVSETEVNGASLFVGGKINTEFIKVVSDDGKTYLDGDTIYVEDEDGNVRVEMGKID